MSDQFSFPSSAAGGSSWKIVVIGKLDSREKKSSYSFEVNIHSSDPNRSEKHRRKKIVRVIFPTSFTSFDSILLFCSSFFLYIYLSLHCSSLVAVFPFSPFPLLESITTEKPLHSTLIEGDRWARRITRCMVMIRGRRTATCTLRKIGKIPNRDWNRRGRTWRNVSPLERRERERGMVRNVRGAVVEAYKGKEKKKKKKKLGGGREEWWKKA